MLNVILCSWLVQMSRESNAKALHYTFYKANGKYQKSKFDRQSPFNIHSFKPLLWRQMRVLTSPCTTVGCRVELLIKIYATLSNISRSLNLHYFIFQLNFLIQLKPQHNQSIQMQLPAVNLFKAEAQEADSTTYNPCFYSRLPLS